MNSVRRRILASPPVAPSRLLIEELERRLMFAAGSGRAEFGAVVDHPFFPLPPGAVFEYRGTDDDGRSLRVEVRVLRQPQLVDGVACTTTQVREFADGTLVESTTDWYAQDRAGNVWYFGEDTTEIEDEVISRAGSWRAGVDGARRGLMMPAVPVIGQDYSQEALAGVAEDRARVLAVGVRATLPAGRFSDLLIIEESTPLQPDVLEQKLYARGVGLVFAEGVSGETEDLVLSSLSLPPSATARSAVMTKAASRAETSSARPMEFGINLEENLAGFTVVSLVMG